VLADASRSLLQRLARKLSTTVHLAVLEGEMVTYLVKAYGGGPDLLTRELIQLEAYCSGVGKVLLAHLDEAAREAYLDTGPFVALTAATITDPAAWRAELDRVRRQGFARDDAEVKESLYCIAVPLRGPDGRVVAALSASGLSSPAHQPPSLPELLACAARIEARIGPRPLQPSSGRGESERMCVVIRLA
jgi:IclR family acetate operon transcriptional repressor